MPEKSFDVIVVGAGFGGATCAALLARRGLKVLLLDKNARAGGKAMALSKSGYSYTIWMVHSAPSQGNVFETIMKELGLEDRSTLIVAPGNGTCYRQSSGQYVRGPQNVNADPNSAFDWLEVKPEEREAALKFLTDLALMPPQDIDRLDDISFQEWLSQHVIPRGVYSFLHFIVDGCFMVPVDLLAASEAVRTVQTVLVRGGGLFGKGGIGRMAELFAQSVEENGGTVVMRAKVERVTVEGGKVSGVVTDKGTFEAPIVISNAGIQPTVLKLVGEQHFDRSYVEYVRNLVPSWGMMGVRYFLKKPVIADASGALFSDQSGWTVERWHTAKDGNLPEDVSVWFEVPSNYDPDAAPPGKQLVITGTWCPANPQMTEEQNNIWWKKVDEMMFKVFPEMPDAIEAREGYSTHDVSALTREQVLPGIGGECIGLGQVVGQCGEHKPSVTAPVRGLFYVGCDAGGTGIGIQQATESGMNVATTVLDYHRLHAGRGS
jgi:prolycopene isomerase